MTVKKMAGAGVVFAVLSYVALAMGQAVPNISQDPCNTYSKTTVPISIATATTTRIINNTSNQNSAVYVCSWWLDSIGGTSTIEYGTGTSCATAAAATALTGAIPASTVLSINASGASSLIVPPVASTLTSTVGNSLCILSGASTTGTVGWMTYVITGPM